MFLQTHVKKDITCIFDWTLAGNCTVLHDLQNMIRLSSVRTNVLHYNWSFLHYKSFWFILNYLFFFVMLLLHCSIVIVILQWFILFFSGSVCQKTNPTIAEEMLCYILSAMLVWFYAKELILAITDMCKWVTLINNKNCLSWLICLRKWIDRWMIVFVLHTARAQHECFIFKYLLDS